VEVSVNVITVRKKTTLDEGSRGSEEQSECSGQHFVVFESRLFDLIQKLVDLKSDKWSRPEVN
jgi:hypothetical protein